MCLFDVLVVDVLWFWRSGSERTLETWLEPKRHDQHGGHDRLAGDAPG